jgi:hypothetical protein
MMVNDRWCELTEPRPRSCDWQRYSVSTTEDLAALLRRLDADLFAAKCVVREELVIRLAVEEAVAKAMEQSPPGMAVRVCYCITGGYFLAEVVCKGAGFAADAPGFGMIRHCLSWMRFHVRGSRVTLCRYLGAAAVPYATPPLR